MKRHDPVHAEATSFDILEQVCGIRLHGRTGVVGVGFHEDSLLGEIRHQQRVAVRVAGDVVHVDRHRRILEFQRFVYRLQLEGLAILRQGVRCHRVRPRRGALEERRVDLLRNHRQPFRHRRANAARVIEMMMAVDDVGERLVRPQFARLGDDRQRPSLVLRRFDEHQVIAEFNQHAVVRLTRQEPDALRHFSTLTLTGGKPAMAELMPRRPAPRIARLAVHALFLRRISIVLY